MVTEIKRDYYLEQLIKREGNGLIKVVTGIRRCGKSYLRTLFKNHLLENGADENHIIEMAFDLFDNIEYRDSKIFFLGQKIRLMMMKNIIFYKQFRRVRRPHRAVVNSVLLVLDVLFHYLCCVHTHGSYKITVCPEKWFPVILTVLCLIVSPCESGSSGFNLVDKFCQLYIRCIIKQNSCTWLPVISEQ